MKTEIYSLRVTSCRLCCSKDLKMVLELRDSALCDAYLSVEKSQTFYPLILNQCKKCDFIQLAHVVPPEIIYEDYLYFTESSPGLDIHFKEYSNTVMTTLKLDRNNLIVDICKILLISLLRVSNNLNKELLAEEIAIEVVEQCGYPIGLFGEEGIKEFKSYYLSKDNKSSKK